MTGVRSTSLALMALCVTLFLNALFFSGAVEPTPPPSEWLPE